MRSTWWINSPVSVRVVVCVLAHIVGQQDRWRPLELLVAAIIGKVAPALDELQCDHSAGLAVGRHLRRDGRRIRLSHDAQARAVVVERALLEELGERLVRRRDADEPQRKAVRIGEGPLPVLVPSSER